MEERTGAFGKRRSLRRRQGVPLEAFLLLQREFISETNGN